MEGMTKGEIRASDAFGELRIAANLLRSIPEIAHSGVLSENPEGTDILGLIPKGGLVWLERAMKGLHEGFPDLEYEPLGFLKEASEETLTEA